VVGARIRFQYGNTDSWADAQPLHTGLLTASPYTPPALPPGLVSFMIVYVDAAGLESLTPARVIKDLGNPLVANVVETIDLKALGFLGTKTGGSVVAGNLVADDTGGLFWAVDDTASFWGADAGVFWPVQNFKQMTYEDQFTPTAAGNGATLTLSFAVVGAPYSVEYRLNGPGAFWSADGDTFWGADADVFWSAPGAYQSWAGQVPARNEPYDVRITTGFGPTQGVVSVLSAITDMPDIVERLNNITLAAGTGTRLPITKTYRQIKNVNLTLQDDGGTARSAKVIDKSATTGPLVQGIDATAAVVAAHVDATVQGY
jgi:hypothetical protein